MKILIVEDDLVALENLELILEELNLKNNIISKNTNLKDAIVNINTLKPDLVFFDIILPDGIIFDIFKDLKFKDFKIIFTTTNTEYAIAAFEMAALHYIIKPVNLDSISDAINRYNSLKFFSTVTDNVRVAGDTINKTANKIFLPVNDELILFDFQDIIYLEAESNYTNIFLTKKPKNLLVSKTLKFYETLFENTCFERISRKHIINLFHVRKISKGNKQVVKLTDDNELQITDNYKEQFYYKMKKNQLFGHQ